VARLRAPHTLQFPQASRLDEAVSSTPFGDTTGAGAAKLKTGNTGDDIEVFKRPTSTLVGKLRLTWRVRVTAVVTTDGGGQAKTIGCTTRLLCTNASDGAAVIVMCGGGVAERARACLASACSLETSKSCSSIRCRKSSSRTLSAFLQPSDWVS